MGLGFVGALVKFHSQLGSNILRIGSKLLQQGLGFEHGQDSTCLSLLDSLVNSFTNCTPLSDLLSTHQPLGCCGDPFVFQLYSLIFYTSGDIFLPCCAVPTSVDYYFALGSSTSRGISLSSSALLQPLVYCY